MNKKLIFAVFFGIIPLILVKYYKKDLNISRQIVVVNNPHVGKTTELPKTYSFEEALNSIDANELKKDLEYLASDELEGRMSGKKGNVVAADFIKKKYESFELGTIYHKFNIERLNSGPKNESGDGFTQNIYAWVDGNDPALKDEIIVIGAHMDHIGYGPSMSRSRRIAIHPGADDNASGTVATMQIAKAFSLLKDKVKRTVVFQSYSAEEMGLIGSRFYCNNPVFPRNNPDIKKHIFMLNMDMISRLNRNTNYSNWSSGNSSVDVSKFIKDLNQKYSFANRITSQGTGGSDHASFYNKRIPVAFLHTGLHDHYHTPEDTADKCNFDGIALIAKYAFELAWNICQQDNKPQFDYDNFKMMEYTHDHGHSQVKFK